MSKLKVARESVPSLQLGEEQVTGLDLVGTVGLPSPFTGPARILVVRSPCPPGLNGTKVHVKYHIKLVEVVSDAHVVTRFVSVDDVRLVRFVADGESLDEEYDVEESRSVLTASQLQKEIAAIRWKVLDESASYEYELRPGARGMVYVPEKTPVLLRYDRTLEAARSLEGLYASLSCPPQKTTVAPKPEDVPKPTSPPRPACPTGRQLRPF